MSRYLILLLLLSSLFAQIKFDHGFGLEIADAEDYIIDEYVEYKGYKRAIGRFGNITPVYQLRGNWKNIDIILDTKIYTELGKFTLLPIVSLFDSEIKYNFDKFYSVSLAHRCIHPMKNYAEQRDLIYGGYNIKLKLHYNMK